MTGIFWAALAFLGGLSLAALGGMASEEIRDRLDHLPHAILRLAALRLTPAERATIYQDEWLPELIYITEKDEKRPITRLVNGTRYAFYFVFKARSVADDLDRPLLAEPTTSPHQDIKPSNISIPVIPIGAEKTFDVNEDEPIVFNPLEPSGDSDNGIDLSSTW